MRKINKIRAVLLFCMLSAGLVAANPFVAEATPVHYGALGAGYDSNGVMHYGFGVSGDSYLYPKQSTQDGDWVNSIYAWQDNPGYCVEAGWYWRASDGARIWFTQVLKDGELQGEVPFNSYYNTTGTRVSIQLRRVNDGTNNDNYEVIINGSRRATRYDTDTRSSRPHVGSERFNTLDYNLGSWTDISYYKQLSSTQYEWRNWVRAQAEPIFNQDPVYEFYHNKLGPDYNYWVYVDANAN